MSQFVFLDSGPLGLINHPQRNAEVCAITDWLLACLRTGRRIIVPAIVCYEMRRELLRAEKTFSVARLEAFVRAAPGRYLPLSDPALRLAAQLWARCRQEGQPTSDPKALDVDVLIAAQMLTFGADPSSMVIATTNPKHLARFVNARHWDEIVF